MGYAVLSEEEYSRFMKQERFFAVCENLPKRRSLGRALPDASKVEDSFLPIKKLGNSKEGKKNDLSVKNVQSELVAGGDRGIPKLEQIETLGPKGETSPSKLRRSIRKVKFPRNYFPFDKAIENSMPSILVQSTEAGELTPASVPINSSQSGVSPAIAKSSQEMEKNIMSTESALDHLRSSKGSDMRNIDIPVRGSHIPQPDNQEEWINADNDHVNEMQIGPRIPSVRINNESVNSMISLDVQSSAQMNEEDARSPIVEHKRESMKSGQPKTRKNVKRPSRSSNPANKNMMLPDMISAKSKEEPISRNVGASEHNEPSIPSIDNHCENGINPIEAKVNTPEANKPIEMLPKAEDDIILLKGQGVYGKGNWAYVENEYNAFNEEVIPEIVNMEAPRLTRKQLKALRQSQGKPLTEEKKKFRINEELMSKVVYKHDSISASRNRGKASKNGLLRMDQLPDDEKVESRSKDQKFKDLTEGEHERSFLIMSEYDDILTNLLLDCFYLSYKTHKMGADFEEKYALQSQNQFFGWEEVDVLREELANIARSMIEGEAQLDEIAQSITDLVFSGTDEDWYPTQDIFAKACVLLARALKPNRKRNPEDFKRHAKRYLSIYHARSGVEIDKTGRYAQTGKVEFKLQATKSFQLGDEIRLLSGIIVELTAEDEEMIASRDFSIMYSSKRNCNCLFCGPARFMNHDCDPNCKFIPLNPGEITFKVIKPIKPGDELTTHYSDSYFGENNCECLCLTCEKRLTGGFGPNTLDRPRVTKARQLDFFSFGKPISDVQMKKSAVCEVCADELNEDNSIPLPLDASRMRANHCRRCYRHELIYDIEWPNRVRTRKKAKKKSEPVVSLKAQKKMIDKAMANSIRINRIKALNAHQPIVVWIPAKDPNDPSDHEIIWWPGMVSCFN
jgi:hypothetical protein